MLTTLKVNEPKVQNVLYHEQQMLLFTTIWWVLLLCMPISWLLFWLPTQFAAIRSVFPVDTRSTFFQLSRATIIVLFLGGFLLYSVTELETFVTNDGISIQYKPLQWEPALISPYDIKALKARRYLPDEEFGGHGLKTNLGYQAFTVTGDSALAFDMIGTRAVLLGSQHAYLLKQAVQLCLKINGIDLAGFDVKAYRAPGIPMSFPDLEKDTLKIKP